MRMFATWSVQSVCLKVFAAQSVYAAVYVQGERGLVVHLTQGVYRKQR